MKPSNRIPRHTLHFVMISLLLLQTGAAIAREPASFGRGEYKRPNVPCLTPAQRESIQDRIAIHRSQLRELGVLKTDQNAVIALQWPLRAVGPAAEGPGYHGISNFVDQDPAFPNSLLDYNCGERTYDLTSGYNHRGTDFFTWPMPWIWMDEDAVEIVAAAPGTIILKDDGNFDENCGFGGTNWNAVYVQHADGSVAWYGHMKSGSPTTKGVGETVAAGEYLGVVGSSGNSTGPHLHLELYDGSSSLVDPYSGPCNTLNAESWWAAQRPYHDSAVNRMTVGDSAPQFPGCPGRTISGEVETVQPGTLVYFSTYYRDQVLGQASNYRIRRPDDSIFQSWSMLNPAPFFAASWWWWSWFLPADEPTGTWTFEVDYEGQTYTKTFLFGTATAVTEGVASGPALHQNWPNPFNPVTTFTFYFPTPTRARLVVYDTRGALVRILADGVQPAGTRTVSWNGANDTGAPMPSGIYFYRLEAAGGAVQTRKMALVR